MSHLDVRLSLERGAFTLDVAFELGESGVTTLSGPSGSGKTTLLRCIAGLECAVSGRIAWGGQPWFDAAHGVNMPAQQRAVGYVTQEAQLFPHLSVRDNLDYGARRAGSREGILDPARVVADLGIVPLLDREVAHLSGGERQRAAIGRALLSRPRLLLLDEPVSALDETATRDALETLERVLVDLPIPCLYVSHDLREAARLADHMIWLESGRVTADGAAAQALCDPRLPFAQAEDAGSVVAGRVVAVDEGSGLARVAFSGGELWIAADQATVPGRSVRVRIGARDVSLALNRPEAISVLNVLPGRVLDVADALHAPSQALVSMEVGDCTLLSRVTRRSVSELGIRPGLAVWLLVKSAAIVR
jgi:molybdate transport system ATP-binding protein